MLETPVLLLIFNRPQHTAKVFEAIRQARPKQLFIAADGPRSGYNEDEICLETRAISTKIDWPCQVHTLFRDTNLGCGKAVSGAINWFFDNVEQGIIIEDDCLPDQSFFRFCDELLDKYACTKEIMSISGSNLLPYGWKSQNQSYHFGHGGIWGWATWKRAWQLYDYTVPAWGTPENKKKIKRAMNNDNWFDYFSNMFEAAYQQSFDTWDVQWFYCILDNNALAVTPAVNLVSNIGFGPGATNTHSDDSPYAKMKANKMSFPLKHPHKIEVDKQYLKVTYKVVANNKKLISYAKAFIVLHLKRAQNYYNTVWNK